MADIKYQCPQCGNQRMVSEFADPAKIMCRDCNCHMSQDIPVSSDDPTHTPPLTSTNDAPGASAPPPPSRPAKKNKLKLARENQPELPPDEPEGVVKTKKALPEETVRQPLELHPKRKHKKPLISQTFLAVLLFLVVGGASGFLRYGIAIEETVVAPVLAYAWAAVLFLHFYIVIKALTVDMMQGIIAFFIPGWSFVYLAISDHFYHKAIIFGLLVGIGYDGGLQLLEIALSGFDTVQEFINTGGGTARRR